MIADPAEPAGESADQHDTTDRTPDPADSSEPTAGRDAALSPPAGDLRLAGLSDRQQSILLQMGNDPAAIDLLMERTALPAHVVLQELTFLSLKGRVKRVDGQTYVRHAPRAEPTMGPRA